MAALLDLLATRWLPLSEEGGEGAEGAEGRRKTKKNNATTPATAAAEAAASRAAGATTSASWTLSHSLRSLAAAAAAAESKEEKKSRRSNNDGNSSSSEARNRLLAVAVFRACLRLLPAASRDWFGGLRHRRLQARVEGYAVRVECPSIIQGELASAASAGSASSNSSSSSSSSSFQVRTNAAIREAVATLQVEDGVAVELAVSLPRSWPLRPATVDARSAAGVSDARARRWLLSASALLRSGGGGGGLGGGGGGASGGGGGGGEGGLGAALRLWRASVSKEFEGVEECLICYSVVLASAAGGGGGGGAGALPRRACKTCGKKFHGACLYKWFRSSAKAASCPHCQSDWS